MPSTYLGLPMFQGGQLGGFWGKIKDQFASKMVGWKVKWLLTTSYLVEIKSTLSAIPIF